MKNKLAILGIISCGIFWFSTLSAVNYTTEEQDAYSYAYDIWVTTVETIDKANIRWPLTRVAMAKMISNFAINVLWLKPDTSADCTFQDVSSSLDAQYNNWVTQACQLWLMWIWNDWKKSWTFNPNWTVTRWQRATAFSRALSKANWDIVKEWDPYYKSHMEYLQSRWIIKDVNNPRYDSSEKRWNVMIMMYRAWELFLKDSIEKPVIEDDSQNEYEYFYDNLDIVADIHEDGTVDVLESFSAFFNVEKHWIIRTIPLSYKGSNWVTKYINIDNINVHDNKFSTSTSNNTLEIKIWEAEKFILWEHIYPIQYSVSGLIQNNILSWNVVWNQFDTKSNNVKITINLPENRPQINNDNIFITMNGQNVTSITPQIVWSDNSTIIITFNKWLLPYQGLYLNIAFPYNYFNEVDKHYILNEDDLDTIESSLLPKSYTFEEYDNWNSTLTLVKSGSYTYPKNSENSLLIPIHKDVISKTISASSIEDNMVYTNVEASLKDWWKVSILYINDPQTLKYVAASIYTDTKSILYTFAY